MTVLEARIGNNVLPRTNSWEELANTPPFVDHWEEFTKDLPPNLTLVHHVGLRSFWQTLYLPLTPSRQYHLHGHHFAPYGEQLPEEEFMSAFEDAQSLCNVARKVLHVRYDMRGIVPETWRNAPFRQITGHSFHKIPESDLATDYINVDGQWWHKNDYAEVLYRQELENQ